MTILADVQLLEPGSKITLYEVDTTMLGGDLLLFHGYPQQGSIFWQSKEYKPWSIEADGFAKTGAGQQPTPTLSVGNIGLDVDGNPVPYFISALCSLLDDLVGSKLIRHTTLAKYLDAINFEDGNPDADPAQEFPPETWFIEQKTTETAETVVFSLSSALDFNNCQLPGRQIIANSCSWIRMGGYRGPYCNYTGTNMFDKDDNPVVDPALDVCGGRVGSCKKRFGEFEIINFGSFPAASLIRT